MDSSINEASLQKCITFLNEIGIMTILDESSTEGVLPGLSIQKGCIVIRKDNLQYPGDLLHEAGHIAVVPASDRPSLYDERLAGRENREAEEMMAIAWSYAACIHLELPPEFVFHPNGYKGGGNYIMEAFSEGRYFGLPMLQWVGMALDENQAKKKKTLPFPHMVQWLRN
jgi:hypothetical protein